jgi:hypothetical protein
MKMVRVVTAVAWLVVCGLSVGGDVLACGDKFLVPTRSTRFQQPPAPRQPAAILIYASPTSELSRRLATLPVADALTKVGYQPTVVTSAEGLAAAIRGRRWDLVVVDVADIQIIEDTAAGSAAGIMPVTYTVAGDAWKNAKRRYPAIVKAPSKARIFVDAVDAALEVQRSNRAPQLRKRL